VELALGEIIPLVYIERDVNAAQILACRITEGSLPAAHIWSDLATFDARILRGNVDILFGGLPCQPFSVAGKQLGDEDERYIWPEFFRILQECEPAMVFLENVPTLVTGGWFRAIGEELSGMGYQIEDPLFLAASDVGAPHKRERVFILAYRECSRENLLAAASRSWGAVGERGGSVEDAARNGQRGRERQAGGAGGGEFAKQVNNWPTPNTMDSEQAGGEGDYRGPSLNLKASNWPTPDGRVMNDGEQPETWLERQEKLKAKGYNGNGAGMPLAIASQNWPTPRSEDSESCGNHPNAVDSLGGASRLWTTPQAHDTHGPKTPEQILKGRMGGGRE
jgi:site-specific DNA-cytosine methylase